MLGGLVVMLLMELPLGIAPQGDAVDVPTNAVLFAWRVDGLSENELSLEDANGASVPIAIDEVTDQVIAFHAIADLQPNATYSIGSKIEAGFAFRRTFRSGGGPDTTAPPAVSIVAPSLTIEPVSNPRFQCGPFYSAHFDPGITEETRAPSYRVTPDGGAPTVILADEWDAFAARHFIHHDVTCMTVQPRDLAGNLGPATGVCVAVNARHRRRAWVPVVALLSVIAGVSAFAWSRRRRRILI